MAFYGAGTTAALGVLGRSGPEQAAARLERQAEAYAGYGRPVMPCFELVTTIAAAAPGPDRLYSTRTPATVVQRYLDVARRHRMILLLDFQPGRDSFLHQVKAYDAFLAQPDVSIALDPEWKMTAHQVPGMVIGHSEASAINAVVDHVAAIVARHRLPQKLVVIHQFTRSMIGSRAAVKTARGLAVTFHIDGFGGRQVKQDKYRALTSRLHGFTGFKLFYRQDTDLMSPRQAMALRPRPDMVSYQ